MPSSHEYGHLLAPWNASAIIADTLTTAPSTIGADILRSRVNSRTSGTDPTSTSARNAEPMPEKLPKWCVHLLGVNHSSRNANSVDQPARESLGGTGTRRARAAVTSTTNHTSATMHSRTGARLA